LAHKFTGRRASRWHAPLQTFDALRQTGRVLKQAVKARQQVGTQPQITPTTSQLTSAVSHQSKLLQQKADKAFHATFGSRLEHHQATVRAFRRLLDAQSTRRSKPFSSTPVALRFMRLVSGGGVYRVSVTRHNSRHIIDHFGDESF